MSNNNIPTEVLAAIAMAIYDMQYQHDVESNVLTIKHVSQEYLPWADKRNAMLQMPTRK
ncbi:hypothetical protein [Dysgonomonas sp. 25]|uniref:hypothetical protein n=1 Tax=Dysgonomonas sp. 25 TaxID=2302933 RepID=UPI0016295ECB|nr:hypothetical protein [Dysgonomonas sp. 25]